MDGSMSSGEPNMTVETTPRQTETALSCVESDLLYEVVDGQIVEKKPMGAYEILVGSFLNTCLDGFARTSNCGRAVSEILFDFGAGLSQRRPDVSYVSYERWSRQRCVPRTQGWAVVPELAVEVISPSNTFEEVVGKVHEYFQVGVQHVWVVAPPQQQVYVYQSPSHIRVLNVQDELTGEPFLPGFSLKLSALFDVEATEA
jgi:Uma2 family endonuclease